MKTALRLLAAIPVVIGLIVIVGGLLVRPNWHSEASLEIRAAPEAVFHYVGDLHTWPGWSAWNAEADPTVKWTDEGQVTTGVGQVVRWEGESMGKGRREVIEADPTTGLRYLERSNSFHGTGHIRLERISGGTRVTWTHEGNVGWNLPARLFLKTFEKALQPALEQSLKRLKPLVETLQPARLPEETPPTAAPAPPAAPHDHQH